MRSRERELTDDVGDHAGEQGGGEKHRGWAERFTGSVATHDDVEVHETTTLELGHLEIAETSVVREFLDGEVLRDGEMSTNVFERSIPELRGLRVPQNRAPVVEALHAERRADHRVGVDVSARAGHHPSVATTRLRPHPARTVSLSRVHHAERRCGQCHEEPGMRTHRCRHTLAADEPSRDDNPGVGLVEVRARGAHDCASVLTRDEECALAHFTGDGVHEFAAETDRVRAASGSFDLVD